MIKSFFIQGVPNSLCACNLIEDLISALQNSTIAFYYIPLSSLTEEMCPDSCDDLLLSASRFPG